MTQAAIYRALGFVALWWIVTEGRADSWALGVPAVLLALVSSLILIPPTGARLSPAHLVRFLGFFLGQSVIGGLQVARLAFVRSELRPAFLDLALRLPAGHGRILLAGILALVPGTLSVILDGDRLRLHVLDERLPITEQVRMAEARIANALKLTLEQT